MLQTDPVDILSLSPEEMEECLIRMGEPRYRGRQLFEGLWRHNIDDYEQMTVWPKGLRARMAEHHPIHRLREVLVQTATDGTVKLLLRLFDGEQVETVVLPHRFGHSVCVSTQVGCNMGCKFCASGLLGRRRNLTAGEMLEQVAYAQRALQPEGKSVRRIDLMGIGEPLDNYAAVVKFMRLVHDPLGFHLSYRHLTLSTSGLVPAIYRLAKEGLPVTLAISLHGANDTLRERLMPVNRAFPLTQLIAAAKHYAEVTGRRVTFEYAMLAGVNDGEDAARELCRLLGSFSCHVNLIPWNPVPEHPFQPSSARQVRNFQNWVQECGISCTIRKELGQEIEAACGQLRHREEELLSP